MTRISTFTGSVVDFLRPDPDTIRIADVAWGLGHIARFNGQTRTPWSVADHSVGCVRINRTDGGDPALDLHLLLHDAAEAFLGDIVGPMKARGVYLPLQAGNAAVIEPYASVEERMLRTIYRNLDVPWPTIQQQNDVRLIDRLALQVEWVDLMEQPADWLDWSAIDGQTLPEPLFGGAGAWRWYEHVCDCLMRPTDPDIFRRVR